MCPWLASDLVLSDPEGDLPHVDGVFLCGENGYAATVAHRFVRGGAKVVDLSADYRLSDEADYERGYGKAHPDPNPGFRTAYGLPEIGAREAIAGADLVANPGCYVTAGVLGVWPLVRAGLVGGVPVLDGKSGVSGAGRSRASTEFLFAESDSDVRAYVPVGHRHTPEIEQALGRPVRFTPHMIPMPRGMFVTAHVPLVEGATEGDVTGAFDVYAGEPFVRLGERLPQTKATLGSNRCDLWAGFDARTGCAVVLSALDNLVKGASGQAIQNMNLLLGLPEDQGLPKNGVWP